MISKTLQIVMLVAVLLYFVLLFRLLKKKRLNLKYTLLWIFSGLLMLVLAAFPSIMRVLANLLGITLPVNALFALGFFCVLLILMSQTVIISRQNERIKQLSQRFALLEKQVRDEKEAKHHTITEEL